MNKQEYLYLACELQHLEIIKHLLKDKDVDPSYNDNFAIRWTSGNGHIEAVKLLLEDERVDPSDKYNEAIKWANNNGHTDVVKLLEKHGYEL